MSIPHRAAGRRNQAGFTLIELMVAVVITLVITGAMYTMMISGQGAFRREPVLIDRQQQIRIAALRIEDDLLKAGFGLGSLFQSFGPAMNGRGPIGVRALGDGALGGGNSDYLEIRLKTDDCPSVRVNPANPRNGANYNSTDAWPACYPEPGWVLAFFADGNAKWGWGHNQHGGGNVKFNFPPGQQPDASQMVGVDNLSCSLDLTVLGGASCPPANQGEAIQFQQLDLISYRIANDTDGVPSLFRSSNGGIDQTSELVTNPPSSAWQLIARGIEDLQVRYRTAAGWVNSAPTILPLDASPYDNIVREVEFTLWARSIGQARLQGETTAAGNGTTAVRGSLVTSVAPRAAQESLKFETDVSKRWQ